MLRKILGFLNPAVSALAGLCNLLPGWLWAAGLAAALLHGCVIGHQRDSALRQRDNARSDLALSRAEVKAQEETRAEVARLAEAGRRAAEKTHAAQLAAINERSARENQRIAAAVAAALDGVRQRPDRPAGGGAVPKDSAGNLACTGAQLYRPDAEFLVREAGRADRVRNQLADCRAKYDAGVTLTAPLSIPPVPSLP